MIHMERLVHHNARLGANMHMVRRNSIKVALAIGLVYLVYHTFYPHQTRTHKYHKNAKYSQDSIDTQLKYDVYTGCRHRSDIKTYYTNPVNASKLRHIYEVLNEDYNLHVAQHLHQADIIWDYYFPFKKEDILEVLDDKTFLNHVPGSSYFTTKEYFVTKFKRDYVPEAYSQIDDRLKHMMQSSKNRWVVKHKDHRGIKLYESGKMPQISTKTFVQKFVDSPLLIEGTKFDVALYVVLTNSVDTPIPKINIFNEWLLRFCPQKYNLNDVDGYVIHDQYRHPNTINSLDFDASYNGRQSLLGYFARQHSNLAHTLEDSFVRIIRDVVNSHTYFIEKHTEDIGHAHGNQNLKFFELVRFDFIIDQSEKVWLMEVNMSPNLNSNHFSANAVLYKKVLSWAFKTGVFSQC